MSERRACSLVGADRKMVQYRSERGVRPADEVLRDYLWRLAEDYLCRGFGYRRLFRRLREENSQPIGKLAVRYQRLFDEFRREGERVRINRVYRLCREEGLILCKDKRTRKWQEGLTRYQIRDLIIARNRKRW